MALLFPPRVEVPCGDDLGGDAGVVELIDVIVIDQQAASAGPLLQFFELRAQPRVVGKDVMTGLPVALHERMADEQLPCHRGLDPRVPHASARGQRHTVQRHPFVGHHLAALGVPVRFAVAALGQLPRNSLDHFRLDAGGDAPVEATGLDQLGHHDPAWRSLGEHRSGRQNEPRVARTQILPAVFTAHPNMREQPGQQRRVHPGGLGRIIRLRS